MMFHGRLYMAKLSNLEFILSLCGFYSYPEISGSLNFLFLILFIFQMGHFSKSNYLKFMKSSVNSNKGYIFLHLLDSSSVFQNFPDPKNHLGSLTTSDPVKQVICEELGSPYFNKFFKRFDIRQVSTMLFVTSPDEFFFLQVFFL